MIARVTAIQELQPSVDQEQFEKICLDVLRAKTNLAGSEWLAQQRQMIRRLIKQHGKSQPEPAQA